MGSCAELGASWCLCFWRLLSQNMWPGIWPEKPLGCIATFIELLFIKRHWQERSCHEYFWVWEVLNWGKRATIQLVVRHAPKNQRCGLEVAKSSVRDPRTAQQYIRNLRLWHSIGRRFKSLGNRDQSFACLRRESRLVVENAWWKSSWFVNSCRKQDPRYFWVWPLGYRVERKTKDRQKPRKWNSYEQESKPKFILRE